MQSVALKQKIYFWVVLDFEGIWLFSNSRPAYFGIGFVLSRYLRTKQNLDCKGMWLFSSSGPAHFGLGLEPRSTHSRLKYTRFETHAQT